MKQLIFYFCLCSSFFGWSQNPGDLDATFITGTSPNIGANGQVYATAVQSDGKIIIAGNFSQFNGTPRSRIARLNTNGTLDLTFDPGFGVPLGQIIKAVAVDNSNNIYIGGDFTQYNGVAVNRIAKLNADGSLNSNFSGLYLTNGGGSTPMVNCLVIQPNGNILIGGNFSIIGTTSPAANATRNCIARIFPSGAIDASFTAVGAGAPVNAIALHSDGRIVVGGDFAFMNGVANNKVARLNADGTLDNTFSFTLTPVPTSIKAVAVQSDNKVLVAGSYYNSSSGITQGYFRRLETNGTLDWTVNIAPDLELNAVAIDANGYIYMGGLAIGWGFGNRYYIGRMNPAGGMDATFGTGVPGTSLNGRVYCMALVGTSRIYVGGQFSSHSGITTGNSALLYTNNCSATPPTVASSMIYYSIGQSATPLTATGSNLMWYTVPVGGTGSATAPTPSTVTAGLTSYWVTQNNGTCESNRTKIDVVVGGTTHLNFDGVNDYVGITNPQNFPSDTYTVEMWFRTTDATGTLFSVTNNTSASPSAYDRAIYLQGGQLKAYIWSGFASTITSPGTYNDGQWHHVAHVCSPSERKLFVDGAFVASTTTVTSTVAMNSMVLGSSVQSGSYFEGDIDEVRIWNVAKTATELNAATCQSAGNESGLMGHYHFNYGTPYSNNSTITTLPNNSTNAAIATGNGTLNNFALTGSTSNWIAGSNIGACPPAAPLANNQLFCGSATVADLVASGSNLQWYSAPTGGTALASSTPLANGTYYVSQSVNGAESVRTGIGVIVQPIPAAPTASNQSFCTAGTVANLTASGTSIQWYSTPTGGSVLSSSTNLTNGGSYYASQTINGCESATRTSVTVTLTTPVDPTFSAVNAICSGDNIAALSTTSLNGISGSWSPALNNTATTTYTFTPNPSECANSSSLTITVNQPVTPVFDPVATVCAGSALNPLPTVSNNSINGTWSPALDNNTTTTYTFTPTAGQCASSQQLTITIAQPSYTVDLQTACDAYTWIDGNTYTTSNNTATVTLTNVLGCDSIVTLDLTIYTAPVPTITVTNNIELNATPSIGYQWTDCISGNVINGANNQQFIPQANGQYSVIITDANGCQAESDCEVVNTISVLESTLDLLSVFPNPSATGIFQLSASEVDAVSVSDHTGRLVYQGTSTTIDLSQVETGVYLLTVHANGKWQQFQLVKP